MTALFKTRPVRPTRSRWTAALPALAAVLAVPAAADVVHVAEPIRIEVDAGLKSMVTVDLQGPRYEDVHFLASWSSAPTFDGVEVLLGAGSHFTGERQVDVVYPRTGTGRPLTLKVVSDHCCSSFDGRLDLQLDRLIPHTAAVGPVQTLLIPVELRARRSWLACWKWMLAFLWFAGMVAMWYRNSYFISLQDVLPRLWALVGAAESTGTFDYSSRSEIAEAVKKALSPSRRFLAWILANPLLVPLPGQRYHEAVEVTFQHERWPIPLLRARSIRNLADRLRVDDVFSGRLFLLGNGRLMSPRTLIRGRTDHGGHISHLELGGPRRIGDNEMFTVNSTLDLKLPPLKPLARRKPRRGWGWRITSG